MITPTREFDRNGVLNFSKSFADSEIFGSVVASEGVGDSDAFDAIFAAIFSERLILLIEPHHAGVEKHELDLVLKILWELHARVR